MSASYPISVVIPLYNKRDYIRRAVESVLAQTHSDLELIVIDDGSTDRSVEQLRTVEDSRLRIVSQVNAGEGAARNKGVSIAQHPWVAFLDADDSWNSGFLTAGVEMIARSPDVVLCATGYSILGSSQTEVVGDTRAVKGRKHQNFYALAHQAKLPFCASSVAIKRAALLECGGFSESETMGADQDLWCRLLTGNSFTLNQYPHANYHQDAEGRVCSTNVPDCELPFSRRLQRQLDTGQVPEFQRLDAERFVAAHLIHIATLNAEHKNWSVASALLADSRTRVLPRKRLPKKIQFQVLRALTNVVFRRRMPSTL